MNIETIVRKIHATEFEERGACRRLDRGWGDHEEMRDEVARLRRTLTEFHTRLRTEIKATRQRRLNDLADIIRRGDPLEKRRFETERRLLEQELSNLDVGAEAERLLKQM